MRSPGRSRSMCEWDDFAGDAKALDDLLAADGSGALSPFLLRAARRRRDGSAALLRAVDARSAHRGGGAAAAGLSFPRRGRTKDPLGYLSNDFHDHATALLLIETLEAHDRERFC